MTDYLDSTSGLTPKALSMAAGVNHTVTSSWKQGKEGTSSLEVTLLNVVYAPEATIIQLGIEEHMAIFDMDVDHSTALTDLETGETFSLFTAEDAMDYNQFFLIFPPAKSRHFALLQFDSKRREEMEKSIFFTRFGEVVLWDFPEVKAGTVPVQK
jgi:hypothetical protein